MPVSPSPHLVVSFPNIKMLLSTSLLVLLATAQHVWAQSSSSYVEPTVPTGKPIPGDYTGALRPQIHYSPPIDFMVSLFRMFMWLYSLEREG